MAYRLQRSRCRTSAARWVTVAALLAGLSERGGIDGRRHVRVGGIGLLTNRWLLSQP